jgi:hypothetical protein
VKQNLPPQVDHDAIIEGKVISLIQAMNFISKSELQAQLQRQ